MAVAKKDELKKLPGYSTGVRVNAAVRMIKLVRPICPNSKLKMVKDSNGKWVADDVQPQNCQLLDNPRWWEYCEEQGHDPYFSNRVWYEMQDRIEIDEETGDELVVGQKRIKHVNRYPNIAQVSASIRHNSGRGARIKVERYGFRRLSDFGYKEVCQFRNCQRDIDPKFVSQKYGSFCGLEHMSLIAADVEEVALAYPSQTLNGAAYGKVVRMREQQLREAASGA